MLKTIFRGCSSHRDSLKAVNRYRCLATSSDSAAKHIVHSPVPDLEYPKGNFIKSVFCDIQNWNDKRALECSISGRYMTYGHLHDSVARWGGFLNRLGVSKGDVVAIYAPNCPQYVQAFYGCFAVGVIVTPVNAAFIPSEIAYQLTDSDAKVIVCWPAFEDNVREAMKIMGKEKVVITMGPGSDKAINMDEMLQNPNIPFVDPIEMSGEEILALPYSSGTTGRPKGTALSHNAFNSNMTSFVHPHNSLVPETTADNQEHILLLLPVYHIAGIMLKFLGIQKGLKLITVPMFNPKTFIDTIVNNNVRILHLVPPLLLFMVNHPQVNKSTMKDLLSLGCGAAPVPPSAVYALKDKIGTPFVFQEVYGMTELIVALMTPIEDERIGPAGKLLANVKGKVIDISTGEALPANTEGEICIHTPSRMSHYLNNPEATAETIDGDGWIHTGDIGFYDEDGFFKIVDRTKDLIKVKAMQVSPSELENILLQHPDVHDVAVIGIPDDRLGEAPKAFIVPKKEIKVEEIHKYLEPLVSKHKRLAGGIVFLNELPKNQAGKTLRRKLRDVDPN